MKDSKNYKHVTVLYDGLCPICLRQMAQFKRICKDPNIHWFDITHQDAWLQERDIKPIDAMLELHLVTNDGTVMKGLDAFICLWSRTPLFRPLAWLLQRRLIYSLSQRYYTKATRRRLRRDGRLPPHCPPH